MVLYMLHGWMSDEEFVVYAEGVAETPLEKELVDRLHALMRELDELRDELDEHT